MRTPMPSDRRIQRHEAAHAVLATVLGQFPLSVEVTGGHGLTVHPNHADFRYNEVILLSGLVQNILDGTDPRASFEASESDLDTVRWKYLTQDQVNYSWSAAADLLRKYSSEVDAVADALGHYGRLDGHRLWHLLGHVNGAEVALPYSVAIDPTVPAVNPLPNPGFDPLDGVPVMNLPMQFLFATMLLAFVQAAITVGGWLSLSLAGGYAYLVVWRAKKLHKSGQPWRWGFDLLKG